MDLKLLSLFRSCCVSPAPIQTDFARRGLPWRYLALALLSLCCAASLSAQYVDASSAGEPVKLTAMWRYHPGDDPAWAAPGFDDSRWTLVTPDEDPQRGSTADFRLGWYRIRVKLPVTHEPLALILRGVESDIYAEGRLVGTIGTPRSDPGSTFTDPVNVIPLPEDLNGRTITLAVRMRQLWRNANSLSLPGLEPSVAPERIQWQRREAVFNQSLVERAPEWLTGVLSLCLGLFSLGLFLLDRRANEYGWAALAYLLSPLSNFATMYLQFHHGRFNVWASLNDIATYISFLAMMMLVWGFIRASRGTLFKIALGADALSVVISLVQVNGLLVHSLGDRQDFLLGNFVAGTLVAVFMICVLARTGISALRGSRDAQVLFIPLAFSWSISLLSFVRYTVFALGWTQSSWSFNALQAGPVVVTWDAIFAWLAIASMGLVLAMRFASSAKREQRLSSEMETARRVQEQLVPLELPATSHFRFEAAYQPATEVGGDLYQVYPRPDGSVMVLMGDVSGKGLKAAMLGTLLVGSAGTLAAQELSPAAMLARLNRRLTGHTDGGFVTCLCCLVAPDGTLTLSNAGQLAPYRNGNEIACASGLPLGLLAEAEYEESCLQLNEGDSLTFLSDGVIEARDAAGELFGFERAQAISAQPARSIADHAVAFGQQDDISVLRLTLQPAPQFS